jgi:tricorn protease
MNHRVIAAAALLLPLSGQNAVRPSLSEPSISPDHSEIAFVSGGDIWTVPFSGGAARLLVSHPANEVHPVYSPDGKRLAFTSTRTGNGDVYVVDLSTGELKRLTFDDFAERVDNWSRDGKYIYYSTTAGDIAGMNDVYRVPADGGTPMPFSADRYASEYYAAPGADGAVAMATKGFASQWWRKGHSHIDETEIWIARDGANPKYERVTTGGAKELWPMWAADGKRLFYTSDRSGTENLWVTAVAGGTPRQVTSFKDGRVLFPSISNDGKTIVFERDFQIWSLDTATSKSAPVNIMLRGVPASPAIEHITLSNQFGDLSISKDGKKIAFVARGDVFAVSTKDGGNAARVTSTSELEEFVSWAPDSQRVTYVSHRNGSSQIFINDLSTQVETQITSGSEGDYAASWSPDGKSLAFIRGGSEIRVYHPETKQERVVAKTRFPKPPMIYDELFVWSPNSKWIAYVVSGARMFRNVEVVSAAGGTPIPVSFVPNVFGSSLEWSPDGTYLLFNTGQRTEGSRIARIDLIPRTPKFREDQFRELFVSPRTAPPAPDPAKPAPSDPAPNPVTAKPSTTAPGSPIEVVSHGPDVKIVPEGIRQRLSLLPIGMDVDGLAISPDGKQLLFGASAAGQTNLYLYSLDELSREPAVPRQLTSTAGFKSSAQFSPDGKEVYFLESGRVSVINVENRQPRAISVTAELDIDFSKQKDVVFKQAWSALNDYFYDPQFHGVDWAAIRGQYANHANGARTPDELRRVISLMLGELNASHLGIAAPAGAASTVTGKLGLRFDRREYETNGRLRITEVIPLGPVDLLREIKPGWYLLAVDGAATSATTNIDELLQYKVDKRVQITAAPQADGTGKKDFAIRPASAATEKNLLYRAWVEGRREYVAKVSNGKLGYVHMPDMGQASLDRLHLDLDVENMRRDGVIIDIRNNSGGFVNAYALDVFARRHYLNMTFRGFDDASPARTVLGQRSLELPTILVTNQHSLSDAEDFTEGYRALKLGKVVGQPTAGWIIYTGGASLIDGSTLRMPFIKITTAEGVNMERSPRPVDVPVDRPHGESYAGTDTQLDVAVRELLKQIDSARSTSRKSTTGG